MRAIAMIASLGRALFGAAFLVAPEPIGRRWIGEVAEDERIAILLRAVGARDVGLGLCTARAVAEEADATGWLVASAASDSIDLVATLAARDQLPEASVKLTLVLAAGSALLFAAAAAAD